MSANVGSADRIIRILVGLALVVFALMGGLGALGTTISAVVGAVLVVTALIRFCPAYRLLGIRTCKV